MEKTLEMGKTSATGSFQLLIGVAASTIIMAVGTVVLTRLMLPAEYGLYGVALIPSYMINLFRDWGMNSAMTKYIANLRAAGKDVEIRDVIVAGFFFEVATGVILSLLSFFLANFIASAIFHRPESALLITIVSATTFAGSLLAAAQSTFVGFERMGLNSFTVIIQAVVKTAIGPALVILGYGVLGAIIGYTLSFATAGIIGIVTLYLVLFRRLGSLRSNEREVLKTMKIMLRYGAPLSISAILLGVVAQFQAFMMATYASDVMIGNYSAAFNFSVLLTFFTIPISTVLFPAFAKLDPQGEHTILKAVFSSSIRYTGVLLAPATMAIMVLSGPMVNTLFGERYAFAPFFLTLIVIGNLFTILGNLSLNSLLAGLGETKMLMKQSVVTLIFGLFLAFVMIPTLGVTGVIVGGFLAGLPSMFWGLHWAWKHYDVTVDFKSSIRIFSAAAISAVSTYGIIQFIHLAEWIRLAIGLAVFLGVYIFAASMINAVTQNDIDNLRAMFSGMKLLSTIMNPLLVLAEVFLRAKSRKTRQKTRTMIR
jgi:O-antigen/teichoic acid export membrane protein